MAAIGNADSRAAMALFRVRTFGLEVVAVFSNGQGQKWPCLFLCGVQILLSITGSIPSKYSASQNDIRERNKFQISNGEHTNQTCFDSCVNSNVSCITLIVEYLLRLSKKFNL